VPKVKFNALGLQNVPKDGSFTPTGLTVTGALCYDSSRSPRRNCRPRGSSWRTSQFKGLVGMNDPSQSGPTFPMIAGIMQYTGKYKSGSTAKAVATGEAFYTALKANGLVVNAVNGATITAMGSTHHLDGHHSEFRVLRRSSHDLPTMKVK